MNFISLIFKILKHLLAVIIILTVFFPVAQWYFNLQSLIGTDFYYTASLTHFLSQNPLLPSFKWLSIWFAGWPFLSNFPILQYYLILPMLLFFGLISAVKIWMLITAAVFFIGCYVVFYRLSRNFALSIILTVASVYSSGYYGALFWGGSLPSFATQAFLSWIIFSMVSFLESKNNKYFTLAILLSGIAIFSHPQMVLIYILPSISILMFFSFGKLQFFQRIKYLILFGLLVMLIGIPMLYSTLGGSLSTLLIRNPPADAYAPMITKTDTGNVVDIKPNASLIFSYVNPLFFILGPMVAVFFIGNFIISKNKKLYLLSILPYVIIICFYIFYVFLYSINISIYHGGWYRLFWSFPLWIGLLIAAFWGQVQNIYKLQTQKVIFYSGSYITNLLFFIVGAFILWQIVPKFNYINNNLYSLPSSAFPNIINTILSDAELVRFKQKMSSSQVNTDNQDYRIYIADQTINIWWNALFNRPLARGYLDQPVNPQNRGYTFWIDAAFNYESKSGALNELTGIFNYPKNISLNNINFLLDWYALKYFESGDSLVANKILPPDLLTNNYLQNEQHIVLDKSYDKLTGQKLNFYEIKDNFVSPILMGINSPTLGIVASNIGYETIIRSLADANLGLRQLIPLKLGDNLNQITSVELEAVDAMLIYDYTYINKSSAFSTLEKYVESGKKIFIDTGNEGRETKDTDLPKIFPMKSMQRKPLGDDWQLFFADANIGKDIDINKFSPPIFDNNPWNFAYPTQGVLRSNSKVLLTNHLQPVLISQNLGKGNVYWSGMNFPYHVIRFHNEEEVKLWDNIIKNLLPNTNPQLPEFTSKYISSEERQISVRDSHGIIFKEEFYPGWVANLRAANKNQNIKIFTAGPSYPGFMYIRLPLDYQNSDTTVTFNYYGSLTNHLLVFISFIICLLLLDKVLFSGKILTIRIENLFNRISKSTFSWWDRDDEK